MVSVTAKVVAKWRLSEVLYRGARGYDCRELRVRIACMMHSLHDAGIHALLVALIVGETFVRGCLCVGPGLMEHQSHTRVACPLYHIVDELREIRVIAGKEAGILTHLLEADDVPRLVEDDAVEGHLLAVCALSVHHLTVFEGSFSLAHHLPMRLQPLASAVGIAQDKVVAHLAPQFVEVLLHSVLGKGIADGQYAQSGLRKCFTNEYGAKYEE